MKKNRIYKDDDGRTIADMSGIGRQPLFLPRLPGRAGRPEDAYRSAARSAPRPPKEAETARPWEETGLSKEEQLWYMLGALKAALLIALAFIGGLGLIVLLFMLAG